MLMIISIILLKRCFSSIDQNDKTWCLIVLCRNGTEHTRQYLTVHKQISHAPRHHSKIILRNYVIDYKLYFQSRETRRMDDWMGSRDVSNMAWGLI